ncbi:unnamed protein product [Schistosoma haematobium]|nr:unnamed protein product [Schistosoma haematobium]
MINYSKICVGVINLWQKRNSVKYFKQYFVPTSGHFTIENYYIVQYIIQINQVITYDIDPIVQLFVNMA